MINLYRSIYINKFNIIKVNESEIFFIKFTLPLQHITLFHDVVEEFAIASPPELSPIAFVADDVVVFSFTFVFKF